MPRAAVVVLSTALALAALPGLPSTATAAEPGYGEVLNILPPGQSGTVTATDVAKVVAGDPQGRVAIDGQERAAQLREPARDVRRAQHGRPGSLKEGDLTRYYKPATFDVPADQVVRVATPRPGVRDHLGHVRRTARQGRHQGRRRVRRWVRRHARPDVPAGRAAARRRGPGGGVPRADRRQRRDGPGAAAQRVLHPRGGGGPGGRAARAGSAPRAPGWSRPSTPSSPGSTPARTRCARSARRSARSARRSTPRSARSPSRGTAPTSSTSRRWSAASSARAAAARRQRQLAAAAAAQARREGRSRGLLRPARARRPRGTDHRDDGVPIRRPARYPPRSPRSRNARPERPDRPGTGATPARRRPLPSTRSVATPPARDRRPRRPAVRRPRPVLGRPGMSNALLVGADRTTTGHPLTVFGPQTGYYAPQLLTEIRCSTVRASRPAVSRSPARQLVVQLGRGLDYAWSATSASNDNVDTVVERLCTTDGSPADRALHGVPRRRRSACRWTGASTRRPPCRTLGGTEPPQADPSSGAAHPARHRPAAYDGARPPGGDRDAAQHLPPRGRLGRRVRAAQRPGADRTTRRRSSASVERDRLHVQLVLRRRQRHLLLQLGPAAAPRAGRRLRPAAVGRPALRLEGLAAVRRHLHADQPAAPATSPAGTTSLRRASAADNVWGYGAVYRSLALSDRAAAAMATATKVSRAQLVGAGRRRGVVDSRAGYTLPDAARGRRRGPASRAAAALLRAWLTAGAHRVDRDRDGAYAHQAAIALFDEWWESRPTPGRSPLRRTCCGRRSARSSGKLPERPRRPPARWPRLGVERRRLVRLREQGPARGARPAGRSAVLTGLLRRAGRWRVCRTGAARVAGGGGRSGARGTRAAASVAGADLRQAPGRHPARDGRSGRRTADRLAEPADVPAGRGLPQSPLRPRRPTRLVQVATRPLTGALAEDRRRTQEWHERNQGGGPG